MLYGVAHTMTGDEYRAVNGISDLVRNRIAADLRAKAGTDIGEVAYQTIFQRYVESPEGDFGLFEECEESEATQVVIMGTVRTTHHTTQGRRLQS